MKNNLNTWAIIIALSYILIVGIFIYAFIHLTKVEAKECLKDPIKFGINQMEGDVRCTCSNGANFIIIDKNGSTELNVSE